MQSIPDIHHQHTICPTLCITLTIHAFWILYRLHLHR